MVESLRGLSPISLVLRKFRSSSDLLARTTDAFADLLGSIDFLTHPIGIEDINWRLHAMFDDRNVTEISAELRQWHVMTCFRRFPFP